MSGRPWTQRGRFVVPRVLPRWGAFLLALVLVALTVQVGIGVLSSGAPAQAATPVAGRGTSTDDRITLTVTSSANALPATGSTVTLTYVVNNPTFEPAYYRSLTDSACSTPGYTPQSGLQNDGSRWWIPAGGTATFTCGFLVTQDTTSTATAVFDTATDATSAYTQSTAVATTTIAVADDPCKTIWYSAENTQTSIPIGGTIGTVSTTAGTPPYAQAMKFGEITGADGSTGSSAFAIDPSSASSSTTPNRAYFIGQRNGTLLGLYSLDLGTRTARKVASSSPATTTYRLTADKSGTVWSWATDNSLYSLAKGSTQWVRHPISAITDVRGQTLSTASLQSGDLAVGGNGNLWLLGADQTTRRTYLIVIPAAQTASTSGIRATLVGQMTSPSNGGFYNGIDFGSDGHLYASTGPNATSNPAASTSTNQLYDVDMATGKSMLVSSASPANVGSVGDLGSCALPRSELRVLKTVSTATPSVKAGDLVTYTVRVANLGKLASVGATLTDAIPANTTYVANSTTLNGVAVADAAGAMPYSVSPATEVHSAGANPGVVAAGATATVRFTVKVNDPLDPAVTRISNQATVVDVSERVRSDDPNVPGDGDATTVPIAEAGIAVTKSADTTRITGSGDVTYTFVVTNTGNEPLARVRLTDAVTSNRGDGTGRSYAPLAGTACAAPTLNAGSDGNGNGLSTSGNAGSTRAPNPSPGPPVTPTPGPCTTWPPPPASAPSAASPSRLRRTGSTSRSTGNRPRSTSARTRVPSSVPTPRTASWMPGTP
ncbi:DUF7507 domain-containing protein [Mobilicoccus pelagius]|uniref:Uncharacterized protein n=1 Tax=Mobilicoccus pelagius NBRC 104925 TaxID=1089455 RepID=H5US03_9MICO|nr:DUF11 domain-containing protein [Mobilicoccus pelagius]GAB48511.1 hypothetical protein MOPEL_073_01520 [Mobilicoccus pelagius NBRC 104925]